MSNWTQLEKCKVCCHFPLVLPARIGGKRVMTVCCDHGKQQNSVESYTVESWNEANKNPNKESEND